VLRVQLRHQLAVPDRPVPGLRPAGAPAPHRRRLLELPGWEQFTALFLFFVSEDDRLDGDDARARFAAKAPHEVGATTGALGRLEARLSEICGWSSSRRP
jgi:hypothetical protein